MVPDIPHDLRDRLLRWARGRPEIEPAVRLLVTTPWLDYDGFVDQCIVLVDGGPEPQALVDWAGLGEFVAGLDPRSRTEAHEALRIALKVARRAHAVTTPDDLDVHSGTRLIAAPDEHGC